jgi:stage V sporulation protein S
MDEDVHSVVQRAEIILRVAAQTEVHKLAHSIQKNVEEGARVVLSCVGVATINQAVKSVAIANGKTAQKGYVLLLLPTFHNETREENVDHTVIRFIVLRHLIGS